MNHCVYSIMGNPICGLCRLFQRFSFESSRLNAVYGSCNRWNISGNTILIIYNLMENSTIVAMVHFFTANKMCFCFEFALLIRLSVKLHLKLLSSFADFFKTCLCFAETVLFSGEFAYFDQLLSIKFPLTF